MMVALFPVLLLALFEFTHGYNGCGSHSEDFLRDEDYIVGGSEVNVADSVVSFQVFKSDEWWNDHEWKHVCGGALLNERWVLTAAHCAKEFRDWGTARVSIGSVKLNETQDVQLIRVRRVFEHPHWTGAGAGAAWDIALVELQKNVRFNRDISRACVSPDNRDIIEGESCAALGWGRVAESADFSNSLKVVQLNLMTHQQCMRAYRSMNGVKISNSHICAGRLGERGRGICQGDLGGPLFCRTRNGIDLVGVATNAAVCGSPQFPGVYIRIDEFIDWIREKTGDRAIGNRDAYTTTWEPAEDTTTQEPWDDTTTKEFWDDTTTQEPWDDTTSSWGWRN